MALNVTFDGFVYDNSEILCDNTCKYQAFFYKVNSGSSSSQWNDVRYAESGASTGYYSFNLGDGDFLGQTGNASSGDKVVVVFWVGDGEDRNALCSGTGLSEWGAYEITLDGSDVFTSPAQVEDNIDPNLSWTFPSTGYVNTDYSSTNSSDDVHNWTFSGTSMNHWRTRYGESINLINTVTGTHYDWGDTSSEDVAGAGVGTHQWSSTGIYTVQIDIYDECGDVVSDTKQIQIYNHAPVPDIICIETTVSGGSVVGTPDTPVTFKYTGTDVDNAISVIHWFITDSGAYGNTDSSHFSQPKTTIVDHPNGIGTDWFGNAGNVGAFTNPGSHAVDTTIVWWDGFTLHALNYGESFTQSRFTGPSLDFYQDPSEAVVYSGVKFINTSSGVSRVGTGLPNGDEYSWTYTVQSGIFSSASDVNYAYEFEVEPTEVSGLVTLCAEWSDGWDTTDSCTDKNVVFATVVTITEDDCYYNLHIDGTSGDGTVTGYSWEIYQTTVSGVAGPWELLWTSPTGIDQQDKKVFFTSEDYFKVTGYIYGSGAPSSDDQILYATEICAAGDCVQPVWNGTGPLDFGGDWTHKNDGIEASYAKYAGSNGLHVKSTDVNVEFESPFAEDLSGYTVLDLRFKPVTWGDVSNDVSVSFDIGGSVNISAHVNLGSSDYQQVLIPLELFGLPGWDGGSPVEVTNLYMDSIGDIEYYIDDIGFAVGTVVSTPIDICGPDLNAEPTARYLRAFPPPNLEARRKYMPGT